MQRLLGAEGLLIPTASLWSAEQSSSRERCGFPGGRGQAPTEVSCPVRYGGFCCHVVFHLVYIIKINAQLGSFNGVLVAKLLVVTQLWGPYRVS